MPFATDRPTVHSLRDTHPQGRDHAVVIGGSIAGSAAARALAGHFTRVTILEKRKIDASGRAESQVPQANHVHLLLLRGKQAFSALCPGILAELEARGALVADASHDVKWLHYGYWKFRWPTGIYTHYCSRSLIEEIVRRHALSTSNIALIDEARVDGLVAEPGNRRIGGVSFRTGGDRQIVRADLVIDASGRGSRMSSWLQALGLQKIRTTMVEARLGYASRIYRRRAEFGPKWKALLLFPRPPTTRRLGVISPIEDDRWMVTVGGWLGDFPTGDERAFLDYVENLPARDIFDVIRDAQPLSDIATYAMPGGLRRHYENAQNWPEGLLIVGDALCSLNPIYSQGMTISALEAEVLSVALPEWLHGATSGAELQRKIAAAVDGPWEQAMSEDLRFPEISGRRDAALRLKHWYGRGIAEVSAWDRDTLATFLRVINLVDTPDRLFRPRIVGKVMVRGLRRRSEWQRCGA